MENSELMKLLKKRNSYLSSCAFDRIEELEAKLEDMKIEVYESGQKTKDCYKVLRIHRESTKQLQAKLDALQWLPVSEGELPKEGDEVDLILKSKKTKIRFRKTGLTWRSKLFEDAKPEFEIICWMLSPELPELLPEQEASNATPS